jgi:hypothetical protein
MSPSSSDWLVFMSAGHGEWRALWAWATDRVDAQPSEAIPSSAVTVRALVVVKAFGVATLLLAPELAKFWWELVLNAHSVKVFQ